MLEIKNVCQIGNVLPSVIQLDYISEHTFLDYDGIIIDYGTGILNRWSRNSKDRFLKRRSDLNEFISHKNIPLIVFTPTTFNYTFPDASSFTPDFVIPAGNFKIISERGEKMNVIKKTPFADFFEKYLSYFNYESVFVEYDGKIILETPYTHKVLAYYNNNAVFLPKLKSIPQNIKEFVTDLIKAAKRVRKTLQIEQPEWAKSYFLPKEKTMQVEACKVESQILELSKTLQQKKEALELLEWRKELFCGSGDSLENEIKKILSELGFKILHSDQNRDDITIDYNGKVAVVEIKGVNGSSGEGQATQLEKWATMHYEKYQVHPKAILIVNSFKEKPLNERTDDTFPNQMLKYSTSREHCLISALQFLGLYYDALDSDKKDAVIDTLFQTIGIYNGYENWSDFIEFENKISQ